jgi:toxin HigB-1
VERAGVAREILVPGLNLIRSAAFSLGTLLIVGTANPRRSPVRLLDRIPGLGIILDFVIRSFGDEQTRALFADRSVRQFQGVARRAKRKLEALNAAGRLEDLRVPPWNRLEKLKGELKDFYSVRVNDQWRVIFKWLDGDALEVRIVDYH